MKPIYTSALAGIQRAEQQMSAAASNIARAPIEGAKALRVEGDQVAESNSVPDTVRDMVALSSAKTQIKANVAVIRTADGVAENLLDIVA